jgi:uncharacterized sulfatase
MMRKSPIYLIPCIQPANGFDYLGGRVRTFSRERTSSMDTRMRIGVGVLALGCLVAWNAFGQTATRESPPAADADQQPARPPNIVLILADDLGYGDVGCFGQEKLKTPRLDAMAAEGMRFTQFYAGAPVCAPSRCVLLTGRHTGRCSIRGNSSRTGRPVSLAADEPTLATVLKKAGYTTGCVGKLGLGTSTDIDAPRTHGFDHFYGYLNNGHAHNCFPEFLYRNGAVDRLRNVLAPQWSQRQDPVANITNAGRGVAEKKIDYAPDLLAADALRFIRDHKDRPFFLLFALNTPHANNEGENAGMEVPDYGEFAGEAWPDAEKGFATMIRHMDRDVGRILDLLQELQLADDTLVLFTSDNGPHAEGGHDPEFFASNGRLRGIKRDLLEGGIRVPTIAWWPGVIPPGSVSDVPWYHGDVLATAAELAAAEVPDGASGDSFVSAMKGTAESQPWARKSPLYWEFYEGAGAQAVRFGTWKAIRTPIFTGAVQLFDISNDAAESHDHSQRRPDITRHASSLLDRHHTPDARWGVKRPETATSP